MSPLPPIPENFRGRLKRFGLASAVLVAAAATTLLELARYCLRVELFSYILIVPLTAGVLTARCRAELDYRFVPAPRLAAGLGLLAALWLALSFRHGGVPGDPDAASLSWRVLAFVCAWIALAVWILGRRFMSGLVFPAAFLIFMTPLPPDTVGALESGLQQASAEVAGWLFPLAEVPFFRTGLTYQLPNVTLEVAPQCSGIRSTLVLFITSLVAGYLFLERPWQRAALAAWVVPLGILRNAFRIVTIGWLCTRYGPEMIDSAIHRRGGPVFFVIALLPLFALLWLLRKFGKAPDPPGGPNPPRKESSD